MARRPVTSGVGKHSWTGVRGVVFVASSSSSSWILASDSRMDHLSAVGTCIAWCKDYKMGCYLFLVHADLHGLTVTR